MEENRKAYQDRESRQQIIIISVISLVVIVGIILILSLVKVRVDDVPEKEALEIAADSTTVKKTRPVEIYFLGPDGISYYSENREISVSDDISFELKEVIQELIKGPKSDSLYAALPNSAEVKAVFLDTNGKLYLDFNEEFIVDHCKGTACEIATVQTLVKTAASNFPQVSQLQILVEGSPVNSIGGQMDISNPFYVIDWM
jgi:spore germination protein GerM